MPIRMIPFVNGYYYHVYNRGTEKRPIFADIPDYKRFLKTLRYYQVDGPKPRFSNYMPGGIFVPDFSKKIVEIVCYCLMPNHFHLLVRQLKEGGITEFVSKLSNSYTKYFNIKHDRVGPLLQGEFKAVLVESDEQLIHVSRYIHLNPYASAITINLKKYEWSSYLEFLGISNGFCAKEEILGFFNPPSDYESFVLDHAGYSLELDRIKYLILEEV